MRKEESTTGNRKDTDLGDTVIGEIVISNDFDGV